MRGAVIGVFFMMINPNRKRENQSALEVFGIIENANANDGNDQNRSKYLCYPFFVAQTESLEQESGQAVYLWGC